MKKNTKTGTGEKLVSMPGIHKADKALLVWYSGKENTTEDVIEITNSPMTQKEMTRQTKTQSIMIRTQ